MKLNLILFFNLISCLCFSQRICEIGDYDFITNKIKGVDEFKYSKIILFDSINKTKNIEYTFDNKNRLIKANFTGRGTVFNKLESSPCYNRNCLEYDYKKKNNATDSIQVKVKDSIETIILKYNEKQKLIEIASEFITVKLTYQKDKIKTIKRNNYLFTYTWDGDFLSNINIDSNGYTPTEQISFKSCENKIKKINHSYLVRGKYLTKYSLKYYYKNNKLSEIKYNNIKVPNKSFKYTYDYNDPKKLKVYKIKANNKYKWHYEYHY